MGFEGGEKEENGDSEEERKGKAREETGKRKEGRSHHSNQRHLQNQEDEQEATQIRSKARYELKCWNLFWVKNDKPFIVTSSNLRIVSMASTSLVLTSFSILLEKK